MRVLVLALLFFLTSSASAQDVVMGEFSTKFVYRTLDHRDRAHNIKLAAKKIHNHVIAPGEIFSYNKTVGQRTEARGFREAHAIVKEQMVDEIGGGICQVSGTLHAAAYYAGLEMVEAQTHSRASTYITPGLDATVSWGVFDFKMRNPFTFPVTIQVEFSESPTKWGGSLKVITVRILGKEKYRVDVQLDIDKKKDCKKVTIADPEQPIGYRKLFQPGTNRYQVKRVRTRFLPTGTVVDEASIYYEMSDRITIVGTKELEPAS